MSITDIACLEDIGFRIALYIDNYSLSNQLMLHIRELERAQNELREANDFKADIINVTSHQLHTPLTILTCFSMILEHHYHKFDTEQRPQYLGYILDSCQRLNAITDQCLNVSKLQRDALEATLKPIRIGELFKDIQSKSPPALVLRLDCEIVQQDIEIVSDYACTNLMLTNLVGNTLRYSPDDSPVLLKAEEKSGEAVLSISDHGEGID
ncbi:MAG: histidine kinase dimerization/phospho-acceptor domain-containing protein [Actinomycetota bacterium]|nr:histidine kinase dimerization/phospho-acceptor domain-containing protein [Actinomycetota bacterium]